MEWDQRIFRFFWRAFKGKGDQNEVVERSDNPERLGVFASLLTGTSIEVRRDAVVSAVDGDCFCIPAAIDAIGDSNQLIHDLEMYLLLALAALFDRQRPGSLSMHRHVFQSYPNARQLFGRIKDGLRHRETAHGTRSSVRQHLWPRFLNPRSANESTVETRPALPDQGNVKSDEDIELDVETDSQLITPDQKEIDDYTLSHNFEKVETAEEFDGRWRDLENEENLAESQDAVQELKLAFRIRTTELPSSIAESETAPEQISDANDADDDDPDLLVDEWNYAAGEYRRGHCRVRFMQQKGKKPGYAGAIIARNQSTLEQLRRKLARLRRERERVRNEITGDDIDLDAAVAAWVDVAAGRTPDERVYSTRRRRTSDLALLCLLDLSLSADGYVAGRRVLEWTREAVLLFCESLRSEDASVAISGFYSNTRNACTYAPIKRFEDDWTLARDRLGALQPAGYTRIGPAIRCATGALEQHPARRKSLLIFSDSHANDYDRYEGRYGMEDVRQSFREGEQKGIVMHALAIGSKKRTHIRRMYGEGNFDTLTGAQALPEALVEWFARMSV